MFNPVGAEEMAFALSVFVSAAGGQVFPSGQPDAQRTLREARECERFLGFLGPSGEQNQSLPEPAIRAGSPLFRAIFAVWEHDRESAGRLSLTARVLGFYALMERTQGAVVERWCDCNPEGEETVLLHPAVVKALASVPLGRRGELQATDFVKAVEAAAETHAASTAAGQVPLGAAHGDGGGGVAVRGG